jgi:hypothetical protein
MARAKRTTKVKAAPAKRKATTKAKSAPAPETEAEHPSDSVESRVLDVATQVHLRRDGHLGLIVDRVPAHATRAQARWLADTILELLDAPEHERLDVSERHTHEAGSTLLPNDLHLEVYAPHAGEDIYDPVTRDERVCLMRDGVGRLDLAEEECLWLRDLLGDLIRRRPWTGKNAKRGARARIELARDRVQWLHHELPDEARAVLPHLVRADEELVRLQCTGCEPEMVEEWVQAVPRSMELARWEHRRQRRDEEPEPRTPIAWEFGLVEVPRCRTKRQAGAYLRRLGQDLVIAAQLAARNVPENIAEQLCNEVRWAMLAVGEMLEHGQLHPCVHRDDPEERAALAAAVLSVVHDEDAPSSFDETDLARVIEIIARPRASSEIRGREAHA